VTLYALHPLRLVLRWAKSSNRNRNPLFRIPVTFDPAPLLYPLLLPVFVALSLIPFSSVFTLPNLMLSLASLPPRLIPFQSLSPGFNVSHWFLATSPLLVSQNSFSKLDPSKQLALKAENYPNFEPELLALLFPLHQSLLPTLEFLTTTSLLPAELQLLDIALINLWLFSRSPQAEILKSVLWIGGLCLFVFCQKVLNWEVALARVPSWRFRRPSEPRGYTWGFLERMKRRSGHMQHSFGVGKSAIESSGSESEVESPTLRTGMGLKSLKLEMTPARGRFLYDHKVPASAIEQSKVLDAFQPNGTASEEIHFNPARRHTFSTLDQAFHPPKRSKTTPSGRPKRTLSSKTRSLLNLTAFEALIRRWLYAFYTYVVVAIVILLPIRRYVMDRALGGAEPFGWALSYLFGDIPSFRLWVVKSNYERWIPLPTREGGSSKSACHLGWAEHLRKDTFGEANTRLFICAYCVGVLAVGMAIVFRLSSIAEVDTRRKVFHGMMVAMFLPTTFTDPNFTALALGLVLAIFLVLDLFRASQLPPVSKPLTYFLAPYVDGRDHRGPVIVSHIFLLIGCAIPLWLSLAGIKQIGQDPWEGWDVTLRDVSMVSGVICVGMGDAAASLIGRRFGRRKWLWSGGKSLEGSFAFAAAVTVGLMASRTWLDIGRWPAMGSESWLKTTGKAVVAATTASLTEAVLTGGNDNVIVPLILWLMVRGLGI
jgi:dolichol kinase